LQRAQHHVARQTLPGARVVAHDELVERALRHAFVARQRSQAGERLDRALELRGARGAALVLRGQSQQLLPQHRGLPLGHARVGPSSRSKGVAPASLRPQFNDGARCERVVVGRDRAPLPGREQLARLHREGAELADRSRRPPAPARAVRVRAVLDEQQATAVAELAQAIQVCHRTGEVHRDDRLRARRDRRLHLMGIDAVAVGQHVGEHRQRAGLVDAGRGADEGVGGGHHLGARLDARGLQRDANRDGAVRARHGVSRLDAARSFANARARGLATESRQFCDRARVQAARSSPNSGHATGGCARRSAEERQAFGHRESLAWDPVSHERQASAERYPPGLSADACCPNPNAPARARGGDRC
jgi:hypothetical protein